MVQIIEMVQIQNINSVAGMSVLLLGGVKPLGLESSFRQLLLILVLQ